MRIFPISARVLPPVFTGAACALLPVSCRPPYIAPPVTPELVRNSQAQPARLERGLRVYQENCAKCHSFENPAYYSTEKLANRIIPAMAKKSKLGPDDEQAVLIYLLAARKLPPK